MELMIFLNAWIQQKRRTLPHPHLTGATHRVPAVEQTGPVVASGTSGNSRNGNGATRRGAAREDEVESDDEQAAEDAPDHPFGLDTPNEPTNPSARLPSGILIDSWKAPDALHLNTALVSPFKHLRLVPKEAMRAWSQAYELAANRLVAASKSAPTGRRIRVRRATFWYAALPALLLRSGTQNSTRTRTKVLTRCNQFINGDYGALINAWDSDYTKAITTPRFKPRDNEEKRTQRAVKIVKENNPHCISRVTNLILGHGATTCDNPNISLQMINKHPLSTGTWTPHVAEDNGSDDIQLAEVGKILDATDFDVGVGPRGLMGHHVYCISRAFNPDANADGDTLNAFTNSASSFSRTLARG